jgi:hypothetical protein
MRIACESVADNELCPLNALVSALTADRRMTSHMDMLRRSNTMTPDFGLEMAPAPQYNKLQALLRREPVL